MGNLFLLVLLWPSSVSKHALITHSLIIWSIINCHHALATIHIKTSHSIHSDIFINEWIQFSPVIDLMWPSPLEILSKSITVFFPLIQIWLYAAFFLGAARPYLKLQQNLQWGWAQACHRVYWWVMVTVALWPQLHRKLACRPPGRSDLLKCISSCFDVPKCLPVHLGVNTLWMKNCQSSHPWSCLCRVASSQSPREPFLLLESSGGGEEGGWKSRGWSLTYLARRLNDEKELSS